MEFAVLRRRFIPGPIPEVLEVKLDESIHTPDNACSRLYTAAKACASL